MDRCNKRDRARANDYQPVKMFQEPLSSAERNVNKRKAKRTQKLGHLCHSPQSTASETIVVFSLRAKFRAFLRACVSRVAIIRNCILPFYGITLDVCSPIRRKKLDHWILQFKREMVGRGEGQRV